MGNAWYQEAVFYEVAVRAFCDGNDDGVGDLRGLTQRLEHIAELGATCIWLLPFYPSPLCDDGYDIADYCAIHPELGTLEDLDRLLARAHALGLRVIADLVLNHTSDQHPWFQAAREGPENPYHDYYVWSDDSSRYADARIIFTDTEKSNWTYDHKARRYYWHRFYAAQPDLNYENPAVQAAMLNVFHFWMERGLDGFRVDAVPYLFEREGTSCENLPETHAFLQRLRAYVDAHYPEALLLGEANQWPQDVLPYFGPPAAPELHMNFHFPLMPRLFMALRQRARAPLAQILEQTPPLPPGTQWATFLRNHDELTLEMVTPEERAFMWETYAPEPRMRLNVGIRRRLWPLLEGDRRQVELLHGLLLGLPGAPVLYYGDELGMGDNIYLPDRYGVRTPMPWDDSRNAGFSTAPPSRLAWPLQQDPGPYHPLALNAAAARAWPHSFFHWLKNLLRVRAAQPVWALGDLQLLHPENPAIFACLRTLDAQTVLLVANLSPEVQAASLDLDDFRGCAPRVLTGQTTLPEISAGAYPLTLAPWGFYWLALSAG